jgi:hypothetical protein
MLKKIRDTSYPAAFVDWMIGTYGREELMPSDRDIMLMSICFIAGMNYGYSRGCEDTEKLAENDII